MRPRQTERDAAWLVGVIFALAVIGGFAYLLFGSH